MPYLHPSSHQAENCCRNANLTISLPTLKLLTKSQSLVKKKKRKCIMWVPSTSWLSFYHVFIFTFITPTSSPPPLSLTTKPSFHSPQMLNTSSLRTSHPLFLLPGMSFLSVQHHFIWLVPTQRSQLKCSFFRKTFLTCPDEVKLFSYILS